MSAMSALDPTGTVGYYPEADVCPGSSVDRDFKTKIDDWFLDSRYSILPTDDLVQCCDRYDYDPSIRTVAHIYMSTLFAGGITFEREDAVMDKMAARWYDTNWSSCFKDVERYQAAVGFSACAVVEDEDFVGRPVALELPLCLILYRLDVYSRPHFVFFERNPMAYNVNGIGIPSFGPMSKMYRYIPDVIVFYEACPGARGNLRSKVAVLSADLELNNILSETTKLAATARVNPPLVLNHLVEKHDPQSVVSTLDPLSMSLGDGSEPFGMGGDNSSSSSSARAGLSRSAAEQKERMRHQYAQMLTMYGNSNTQKAEYLANAHISQMAATGLREYSLPEGKAYVAHQLPEGPGELFVKFKLMYNERVFNIFGIPLGMISQSSSLGSKTSMNENAYVVFVNTQKQKKQQLLNYMHIMYERIYRKHHLLQRLQNTPRGSTDILAKDDGSTRVNILMTGLPEDQILDKLYLMGVLTFEAYCRFVSSKHCIPDNDFNIGPKLNLKDLNGITPEPEGSKPSKATRD